MYRERYTPVLCAYETSPAISQVSLLRNRALQLPSLECISHIPNSPLLHSGLSLKYVSFFSISIRGKGAHLHSPGTHVRNQKYPGVTNETRMNLRLLLEDIETGGVDLVVVESFDEGCFINDGASGRVDNDNAVLHLGEFGFADDVVGVFLIS